MGVKKKVKAKKGGKQRMIRHFWRGEYNDYGPLICDAVEFVRYVINFLSYTKNKQLNKERKNKPEWGGNDEIWSEIQHRPTHGSNFQIRSGCIAYLRRNLMPWITISLWSALNPLAMTGEARDILPRKGGNSVTFLKSWHASPSRPSNRSVITMKTLKFWEGVTWSKWSPWFHLPNYRLSAYTWQQILTVCMIRIKRLNYVRETVFHYSENGT